MKKTLKNNSEKIVKYNKKKIIIITSIVVALIAGISVGIYFAVRPKERNFPSTIEKVSPTTARDILRESDDPENEDKLYGVYIHNTENSVDKEMVYGSADENGDYDYNTINGPFGSYAENLKGVEDVRWISLTGSNSAEIEKNISQMFFGTNKDEPEPINSHAYNTHYLGTASEVWEDPQGEPNFMLDYGTYNEDEGYWNLVSSSIGEEFTYDGATWMWFKGGQLKGITSGVAPEEEITASYWFDAQDYFLNVI